jgi:tRNA-Thr(GGU) m(6)t(6)A37 methyltransferase TsaA
MEGARRMGERREMMPGETFAIRPIGRVHSTRRAAGDDNWDAEDSSIELDESFTPGALAGIETFSHAEIFFVFDQVDESGVERSSRHPRGNRSWPLVGIFAQRAKDRPNRLGATIVEIVARSGRTLKVKGLDAIDGTPVIDIKPVMTPSSSHGRPCASQTGRGN